MKTDHYAHGNITWIRAPDRHKKSRELESVSTEVIRPGRKRVES
ncbi:MAG: hypothetical protein R3335_12310 [Anaerolineales bacterium]|nr:hypothetical protein [Anaerolineales bacterium]